VWQNLADGLQGVKEWLPAREMVNAAASSASGENLHNRLIQSDLLRVGRRREDRRPILSTAAAGCRPISV
jgi:hypothetical protein